MFTGQLEVILIGSKASEPMNKIGSAQLDVSTGIAGDRYPSKPGADPGREVTLIEAESIEAVGDEYDFDLTAEEARRNLVTRNVPLNHLVGKVFRVGDVRLRGIRLCEPCKKLQRLTGKDVLAALAHRGGLRAEVVTAGVVHVGDEVKLTG